MLVLRNVLSLFPILLSSFGSAKVRTFPYYAIPTSKILSNNKPIPPYYQYLTKYTPTNVTTTSSYCPIKKIRIKYLQLQHILESWANALLNDLYLKQIRIVAVFHI